MHTPHLPHQVSDAAGKEVDGGGCWDGGKGGERKESGVECCSYDNINQLTAELSTVLYVPIPCWASVFFVHVQSCTCPDSILTWNVDR